MPDPTTTLISVNGGGKSQMTLAQLMDSSFGAILGRSAVRTANGWSATHAPRFAFKSFTGVAATTGGAITSWTPEDGAPVIILRAFIYTTTVSAGAASVVVGVAANITTSANNLIDTLDVHTATVCVCNFSNPGTNGKPLQLLTGAQAITVTGTATTVGLVGNLYVEYLVPST